MVLVVALFATPAFAENDDCFACHDDAEFEAERQGVKRCDPLHGDDIRPGSETACSPPADGVPPLQEMHRFSISARRRRLSLDLKARRKR